MEWKDIKVPDRKEPSRFSRIVNGDRDHINGLDDGEWPTSERPSDYYAEEIIRSDEVEIAVALAGSDIY
jgi:hypothetical protein